MAIAHLATIFVAQLQTTSKLDTVLGRRVCYLCIVSLTRGVRTPCHNQRHAAHQNELHSRFLCIAVTLLVLAGLLQTFRQILDDPPYNLHIKGIGGRGSVKHKEFAMASGEMSSSQFESFLKESLRAAAAFSRPGALNYTFMDWRHLKELIAAGNSAYDAFINMAIWVKNNAGQGPLYRSQHEHVAVFRVGDAAHLNNIQLGRHGRSRTNVWHYPGVNSFGPGRMDNLRDHPTVKPVALVCDILRDCTRRNDIVLDTFCGSGTIVLAAERLGRCARAVEIEPRFVDVTIRRFQSFSGKDAIHVKTGRTFDEIAKGQTRKIRRVRS